MKDIELGQILKILFQSVYQRLKMSKKERQSFFHFVIFHIGSTKVVRKSRYFMQVEGPGFKKIFTFKWKNPPTSENTTVDNLFRWLFYGKKVEVKRWPRSFTPARFFLTITLNYFIYLFIFIFLFCQTQWITSRIKTITDRLINIKFKICTLLGRSDCGGEISEKPSLWGIEIPPHGQFKY